MHEIDTVNEKSAPVDSVDVIDVAELERADLETALAARGLERFRARQLFRWIYRRGVTDVALMTDLPRELRAALATQLTIATPEIAARERSVDGTEKFLLQLADGRVELLELGEQIQAHAVTRKCARLVGSIFDKAQSEMRAVRQCGRPRYT